jgi:Domain of unknown function (DUF4383)
MPNTAAGSHALRATTLDARAEARRRSPAFWYCLLGGATLLLVGLLGFIADASFDTSTTGDADRLGNAGGTLQGDSFLGFEVNGWHNVVHIASGLLLLFGATRRGLARTVALAFGVVYGAVALIGLIDGNDVLGLIPVNPADNVLHIGLSALAIVAALASRDHRRT